MTVASSYRKELEAGFTLLELLLVLTIIILTIGVVGVNFSSAVERARMQKAVWGMVVVMRTARVQAVKQGKTVDFSLIRDDRQYQLSTEEEPHVWPEALNLQLKAGEWGPYDGAYEAIYFYPDGSSSGGELFLTSGKNAWSISVDWLTGQVVLNESK
ncbi:type II secretion system protein GspH [Aestuariicella hydrocarbonica]|uniref:Type II secretion system protein H n=1 Tax=Pseudomaricurvus hydrocarbonicus TaxID=1470433 RepID=A0A9E5JWC1_9GAMM|nr:GspH/FimT family pseudopilin [Aestuariicella hydrocarbonica]NHO65771.1 type II secretion system protein GspH [Aestuariicella hydrocarbonica]